MGFCREFVDVQYITNVVLALSKLFRAILGGDGSQTLSQATAHACIANKWFALNVLKPTIDTFFYIVMNEKDHVMNSIQGGPSLGKTLWDWSK